MLRYFSILLILLFSCQEPESKETKQTGDQLPKLVVGIVVDQMRYDYLKRFWNKFENGGFKRLVNDGFNCKNTHFNYAPTYTGPGHASIYTGATPALHGIIANYWYDKYSGSEVYCVDDADVQTIGSPLPVGLMSPKNMLVTTITDELKLSNKKSKTIGVSLKDRGAILPAGHMGDAAYWFDGNTGNWVTSTHYMDSLPLWAQRFNKRKLARQYLIQKWETLLPIEEYTESLPDDNPYEGLFEGEEKPVFPRDLFKLKDTNGEWNLIKATPFGNSLTKDMALAAIEGEQLGTNEHTDFLCVSFSSTDYVGHQFGSRSIELEDTYLRLDRDLSELLTYLDENIGVGNYMLFLTADHGAVSVPAYLMENKVPAGYFISFELKKAIEKELQEIYGEGNWIANFSNFQFFLNHQLIAEKNVNVQEMKKRIAEFSVRFDGVANALTSEELLQGHFENRILQRVQNGFSQKYSGDVVIVLQPSWVEYPKTGTTHGSPYNYDTHVPLLWFGSGINSGSCADYVSITDIAPTLATLLNVQFPNGCSGNPIVELTSGR